MHPEPVKTKIEAELNLPGSRIQLILNHFAEPPEYTLYDEGRFRLELSLTPRHRSARACYTDFWSAHRFERVGDMFIVPPGAGVRVKTDECQPQCAIVYEFDAGTVFQLFEHMLGPDDGLLIESLDIRNTGVEALLRQLAEQMQRPGTRDITQIESIRARIPKELVRHGVRILEQRLRGGLAPWRLRKIDDRLGELREAPTLEELAQLCNISVRQLTRGFRASRGYTLGSYIARSQIEHAKQLLGADRRICDIASMLGFSSSSNFCFAFRRATGVSPGEFQGSLAGAGIIPRGKSESLSSNAIA